MTSYRINRPSIVLIFAILLLAAGAALASRASTKALNRAIAVSAAGSGVRAADYHWEFLRDGMVFGRLLSTNEAIYLVNVRLFGGDHRFTLVFNDTTKKRSFKSTGIGPVSPHALRIATVIRAYFGEPLEDSTALDGIITHSIQSSVQTVALYEAIRKEPSGGN